MATGGWVKDSLPRAWWYTIILFALDDSNVYLRQEGKDVDCQEELDGEVLEGIYSGNTNCLFLIVMTLCLRSISQMLNHVSIRDTNCCPAAHDPVS